MKTVRTIGLMISLLTLGTGVEMRAQQNPSPTPNPSSQAAQQKAARDQRIAEKRAEITKRPAERQAKNAQRMNERKEALAKRSEELKARRAEQELERKAASAKRSAERKAKSENEKAARQASMARRAAESKAKQNEAREAAAARRAAAAQNRRVPADGTFRFLSSRMNAHSTKVVKGAPYSAVATTEYVQKFVDGNQIVRRNEAAYYRDGEGRTRVEQKLNTIGKWTASGEAPTIITIGDPVAGTYYNLDPRTRTAMNNSGLGKKLQQQHLRKTGEAGPEKTASERANPKVDADGRRKTEDLGKQRFEGVEAEGKRVITTIPAGEIGNARPIEITDESWFSPELQALLMTKHHDPRNGDTIYRLTNISRREPDRSLFQVPPDYTIVDRSGPGTAPPKTKPEKPKESKSQVFD